MADSTRRDTVLAQLTEGVAALTSSDAWRRWLDVQSRFHHYSFGNCLLIAMQRPDATRVAGFHTWRKVGRNVRRGEKAIWILAPIKRRVGEPEDRDDQQPAARVVTGFKGACVFDISQTDGAELPQVCTRLDGADASGAYAQLVAVAHSIGFTVEEDYLPRERNGDCSFTDRRIRVQVTNAEAQQMKTLAHELAHALLHEEFSDRALAELEAESVAYVVCNAIGLPSDTYSFGYVASWAGGGDEAIAGIKASGQRIQQAANRILDGIEVVEEVAA